VIGTYTRFRVERHQRKLGFPHQRDQDPVKNTSDRVALFIGPSESSTRPDHFRKVQASYTVIEKVNTRPVDIPVVLISSPSNQVKVPINHHWVLGAVNHLL
jgi:hypothetical protein